MFWQLSTPLYFSLAHVLSSTYEVLTLAHWHWTFSGVCNSGERYFHYQCSRPHITTYFPPQMTDSYILWILLKLLQMIICQWATDGWKLKTGIRNQQWIPRSSNISCWHHLNGKRTSAHNLKEKAANYSKKHASCTLTFGWWEGLEQCTADEVFHRLPYHCNLKWTNAKLFTICYLKVLKQKKTVSKPAH